MRKIYQKYFELPEEGKGIMGEQVFFARLAVSITCIMLYMFAMGFTAYAFFTASVSSNMNQIQAANYALSIQSIGIVPENANGSVMADSSNPNKYTLQKGMYDFSLAKSGNASTGYCMIKINNIENEVVVTRQIADTELRVRIEVAQKTDVEFVACWGTYHIHEDQRFQERTQMIVVDGDNKVNITTKSDSRTVSLTATAPVVTSEATTITQRETLDTITTDNADDSQILETESAEAKEDIAEEIETEDAGQ